MLPVHVGHVLVSILDTSFCFNFLCQNVEQILADLLLGITAPWAATFIPFLYPSFVELIKNTIGSFIAEHKSLFRRSPIAESMNTKEEEWVVRVAALAERSIYSLLETLVHAHWVICILHHHVTKVVITSNGIECSQLGC
jgi:hypothetical protein